MTNTVESTRHPDWIPVKPGDGAIRGGDRYRIERSGGSAYEFDASYDWEQKDFIPDATYFIWPRPEPKPWDAIREGRENAKVMAVSVGDGEPVVGTYWREDEAVMSVDVALRLIGRYVCHAERITSAVPVTVVPSEELEVVRSEYQKWDTGVTGSRVFAAVQRLLAAVDGADS